MSEEASWRESRWCPECDETSDFDILTIDGITDAVCGFCGYLDPLWGYERDLDDVGWG